jgi:Holliday junction resolvasome RuvABC endonuclease subunit
MSENYIGIDPGQSGGLAVIFGDNVEVVKMPPTEQDIWKWFLYQSKKKCFALIEKVHSMPNQGVVSTFKFGQGYGVLRMALIASRIPFEEISPMKWQKYLGIPSRHKAESKTEFKNRLKAKSQQLFPKINITLSICDALLIAECNKRMRSSK